MLILKNVSISEHCICTSVPPNLLRNIGTFISVLHICTNDFVFISYQNLKGLENFMDIK